LELKALLVDKKNVFLLPSAAKSNQYYANLARNISECGYAVSSVSKFMQKKHKKKRHHEIFILSWQEDSVVKEHFSTATRQFLYLLWVLLRISFYRGKLVWIKHNYKPHKLNNATFIARYYYRIVLALLGSLSILKIAHSRSFCLKNPSFQFVPHPSYQASTSQSIRERQFFLFGKIMRYKNVPKLLSSWPDNLSLDISGAAEDDKLANEIEHEISQRKLQVTFENGFVDDDELNDKLSKTKVVICANAEESMIVSGVIIHALSAGCAVLARKSEFAEELQSEGFPIWLFTDETEISSIAQTITTKLQSKAGLNYSDKYNDASVHSYFGQLFGKLE
jgi:beta-1,4-mannosyltransferase